MKKGVTSLTLSKDSLNLLRLLKAQAIKAGFDVSSYDDLIVVIGNLWDIAQVEGCCSCWLKRRSRNGYKDYTEETHVLRHPDAFKGHKSG